MLWSRGPRGADGAGSAEGPGPQPWTQSRVRERQPSGRFKQCRGERLGPGEPNPDSGLMRYRKTCGHMPAGPGSCPGTEAGWAEVCATLCLAQGKPWGVFGNSVPQGRCSQEEQARASSLSVPARAQGSCLQSLTGHSNGPSYLRAQGPHP